jgi:XTP/dITP diphosphohydrolase
LRLVLASRNKNKHAEFRSFFEAFAGVELLCPSSADGPGEVEEAGASYEENAVAKARAWSDFCGVPAIADDSGLEVRCLGWRPGIASARIAEGGDGDRVSWLLDGMKGASDRRAGFVACLVLAFPPSGSRGGGYFSVEGRCWGNISKSPRGDEGFGYDPVFVPDGFEWTFSELGREVKSKISHRSIAMRGLAHLLPSVLKYRALCEKKLL